MKVAFGCDHGGFWMKEEIIAHLKSKGFEVVDFGTNSAESTDYPIYGKLVGEAVAAGECELGVLICGTGVGISLAANKVPGIRAACCSDAFTARLCRMHNAANIIAFGGRVVGVGTAKLLLDEFFGAEVDPAPRHHRRVDMIMDVEKQYLKRD